MADEHRQRDLGSRIDPAPVVTVVIPTRARPHLLATTLASVLGQRHAPPFEVLVIDDGSPTPLALPADPRLRVLRNEVSCGVAVARNTGLAVARGRYVAFVDDDDLWSPDKLAAQLAALEAAPERRWCCVGAVQVDESLSLINAQAANRSGEMADELLVANVVPGGGSGVLAETSLLREVGGFDDAFGLFADWELWIRLALASPMAAAPRPLLAYRVHSGAMTWRLEGLYDELDRLEAKHAAERAHRGLAGVRREQLELWLGDRHQRAGRRRAAARSYLRSARRIGRRRAGLRAVEALTWPGAYRLRDRRWGRQVPSGWRVEVESWLAPLRRTATAAPAAQLAGPPADGPDEVGAPLGAAGSRPPQRGERTRP